MSAEIDANVVNGNGHNGDEQRSSEDEGDARGNSAPGRVPVIARMPTERHDIYYNMNHKNRGFAVIFNHENFDIAALKPRTGTRVDGEKLKGVLRGLGFTVVTHHDKNVKEVNECITELALTDHTNNDCVMVCVLSHGELGMLYAKDSFYKPEMLWHSFTADKCPSLAGKPKIFFIQACQGDKLDSGITLASRTETDGPAMTTYKIPIHADFLISFSTVPGYYSWRNTTRGSWFIQALTAELEANGQTHDLLTLMTFVSQRVAYDFESNTPDSIIMHRQKQIPCTTTMLTRLLVFANN